MDMVVGKLVSAFKAKGMWNATLSVFVAE